MIFKSPANPEQKGSTGKHQLTLAPYNRICYSAGVIKKIHYCWLGSEIPAHVRTHVQSWQRLCPDYDYFEWNNSNASYPEHRYWQQAASSKRWAFASDVVQLRKLYEHGGFYLDCDVVIQKPLDKIPAPSDHLIMGYMYDCALSGGFMYSPPGHPLVAKMLEYYDDINPGFFAVNNTILTDCINNNVADFLLNGKYFQSEEHKLTIFPKEYFCHPSLLPGKSFIVDLFSGSWKSPSGTYKLADYRFSLIRALRRKVSCYRALCRSEYLDIYKQARKGIKELRMEHWRQKYGITGGAIKL